MLVYGTLFFFYNNIFYKNIEAEIYNIYKNISGVNPRLRFRKDYYFSDENLKNMFLT